MTPETININHFSLANEKVVEPISMYIELGENYLIYAAEYYGQIPNAADAEDHSLGWKDIYANFRIKIKRDLICSVEILWIEIRQVWKVEIECNGYPNTIGFYFATQKPAIIVYEKLDKFIFG